MRNRQTSMICISNKQVRDGGFQDFKINTWWREKALRTEKTNTKLRIGRGWGGMVGREFQRTPEARAKATLKSKAGILWMGAGRSQSLCARAMRPRCRPPRKRSHLETPRGLGPAARARAALRLALHGGWLHRGRPWIWGSRSLRSLAGSFAPLLAPRDGEAGEGVERGC